MSMFHAGEFLAAVFHRPREFVENKLYAAFLLHHSPEYKIALVSGWAEFFIELWLFPTLKTFASVSLVAGCLMLCSGGLRIVAMWQCGSNFSHLIETSHRPQHRLVTTGVYAHVRHPAYFAWFWWSVLTQVVLLNPVCTVLYACFAWLFFRDRIPDEEELLCSADFFGQEYEKYRRRVRTGIPFIR
eukprot:TRINITY_DN9824_c0_g1_i4.p1 TRINITY_DN9824_c0_g1~~TRINITY_DN9824_c0_g1_i4.p1  ORF type:complete len:186 (+),score=34.19 TRINITY_DN9824_c0_g1_i4:226-783(+)